MSKVLIFDFDGTIAESSDMIISIIAQYVPGFTREAYVKAMKQYYEDHFVKNLFRVLFYQLKLIRKTKEIRKKINEKILEVKPFEDMKIELKDLNALGYEMFIISSNFRDNILEFLEKYNINYFKEVHADGSVLHKAKTISQIKNQYSSDSDVYYIGDELRDIDAARKAGVKEVGITWGLNSRDDFEEFGTKIIFDKASELKTL